ncbi:unnamed protein product [Phaedon cochleariae]|uniref:ubiquitinyl hydrolase 1 n=1 Tax=Phaedon cochleariae TaxID=80249 RepID=A0A9N9SEP7_PHACE|nr:unnamed protein product [Phaedon cochleariae]
MLELMKPVLDPQNTCIVSKTVFEKTPIRAIFGGQLRSKIMRAVDVSTVNIQLFLTMQLNVDRVKMIRETLETLVNKEHLEGLTSPNMNEVVQAWQQLILDVLPVILILHLKFLDFKPDGCTKIINALEFPVNLEIESRLSSKSQTPEGRNYKLFAVVYHVGDKATRGHYFTDAFQMEHACWLRFDDATVRTITEQQVLQPQDTQVPYLLFYRRGILSGGIFDV